MTDESADPADAAAGKRFSGRLLALLGVLILVVLFAAGYSLTTRTQQTTAATPTLVVLSLHPADSAPDDNILAEELSEELTTRLARVDGLRLISQTSALRAQAEKWDLNDPDEMPSPDFAVELAGLEKMLRDGWPSYYLLLWMPEYAAMRRSGVPGVPQTHASAGLLAQRQMADAMPSCGQWRPL